VAVLATQAAPGQKHNETDARSIDRATGFYGVNKTSHGGRCLEYADILTRNAGIFNPIASETLPGELEFIEQSADGTSAEF